MRRIVVYTAVFCATVFVQSYTLLFLALASASFTDPVFFRYGAENRD